MGRAASFRRYPSHLRRLALSDKKLRNVGRRLRALARWAASFEGWYPVPRSATDKIVHYKLPVHLSMVEGRQSTPNIRRECAQRLIDACARLQSSKPPAARSQRVVAQICLPDLFSSELCIHLEEDYFPDLSDDRVGKFRHHLDHRGRATVGRMVTGPAPWHAGGRRALDFQPAGRRRAGGA
jgi:hypothetical protein